MPDIAQLRRLVARMEGKPVAFSMDDNRKGKGKHALPEGYFYLGHGIADFEAGPFPSYALHEVISGPAAMNSATGFSLGLLKRNEKANCPFIWLEEESTEIEYGIPYPVGISAFGLDPARFILVRCPKAEDVLKAADDALATSRVGGLLLSLSRACRALDFTATRRLHLAAEKAHSPVVLVLGKEALKNSNAATRWQIKAAPSESSGAKAPGLTNYDVTLLRNRTGYTGHWLMQWNIHDQIFTTPQEIRHTQPALSGTRFSSPADRPSEDGFAA